MDLEKYKGVCIELLLPIYVPSLLYILIKELKIRDMITYDQVKEAMINPPTEDLVFLFNDLETFINNHPLCILDENPFEILDTTGNFCISATSIQSDYIAFVLGKHQGCTIPADVMELFFNIDSDFQLQFARIQGAPIDGCIFLLHYGNKEYDLQEVYTRIYQ